MTPRERVESVLRGERVDRTPFTVYTRKLPQCEAERRLRSGGLCMIAHQPAVFTVTSPNTTQERVVYAQDGAMYVRTNVRTPGGELHSVERMAPDGETSWYQERLFKGPEDYAALTYMIRDQRYEPNYEAFAGVQAMMGKDGVLIPDLGYSPFQEILYSLMGLEAFAAEWAERRDEVLKLYDTLVENRRRLYPVVARSPALAATYDANVSAEVVGLDRFRKYYAPHYDEFAEWMHDQGKVVGGHFDANMWALAEEVAQTEIDFIEAFTPRPEGDMSVAEARTTWPDKVLWINFPSSLLYLDAGSIEEATREFLWEAAPGHRFMIGITEDVPRNVWPERFAAILRVINREGALPIRWKSPRLEGHRDSVGSPV